MMQKVQKSLIIKVGFVVFLLAYLLILSLSDTAKDLPVDAIAKSMKKNTDLSDLSECGKTELMRFYGIQEDSTEGYFFYKSESSMSVDEILIVKTSSRTEAASVLESMQSHLDSQKKTFEGYGTDQFALLNEAFVETRGNYAYYMCGKHASAWKDAFLKIV